MATKKISTYTQVGAVAEGDLVLGQRPLGTTALITLNGVDVLNNWTAASASSASSLKFYEDTDNGTNSVTLIGPASTADATLTLPAATDTLIGKATTDTLTNKTFDVDGTGNSLTNIANANVKAAAAIDLNKLAATTVSRALVSDASGFITAATTTSTELDYVNGVTSAIQTQLNAKQTTLSGASLTAATVATTDKVLIQDADDSDNLKTVTTQAIADLAGGVAPEGFSVYRNATQSITAVTFTKCQLNTEDYDISGTFDNATNYRHTPTTAGKYLYIGQVAIGGLSDGNKIIAELRKNGTNVADNISVQGGATDSYVQVTKIIEMNGTTDYVELYAFTTNTLNTVANQVFLQGMRVQ